MGGYNVIRRNVKMIGKKVSLKAVGTKWVQYYKIGSKTLNPSMSFGLYYHPNMSCGLYYNPNSFYLEPKKSKNLQILEYDVTQFRWYWSRQETLAFEIYKRWLKLKKSDTSLHASCSSNFQTVFRFLQLYFPFLLFVATPSLS